MKIKGARLRKILEDIDTERARKLLTSYAATIDEGSSAGNEFSKEPGVLVWAKNFGSVYWPAFLVKLEDKPDVSQDPGHNLPGGSAMVIFLEYKFRRAAITWDKIIPVVEASLEEQTELIIKLNLVESKKSANEPFKKSIVYLKEFLTYSPDLRHREAQSRFLASEANRAKSRKSSVQSETKLNLNGERDMDVDTVSSDPLLSGQNRKRSSSRNSLPIASSRKGEEEPSRKHGRYSLRPPPPPPPPPIVLQPVLQIESSSSALEAAEDEAGSTTSSDPAKESDKKKWTRPKAGGKELKDWCEEGFKLIDKTFKFEAQKSVCCSARSCGEEIKEEQPVFCHDFPFHLKCLTQVPGVEDGDPKYSCDSCIAKECFLCHTADDKCVKCSKCELRYHVQCLRPFPQAEIQSETGPIVCPLHFCHTCIAEHQILKKVRNYKACKSSSLRCLYCPTTYHRACLPASSISSVMTGSSFIVCPRHQEFQTASKCRRLGCFMCNKRLVSKNKSDFVNCIKCPVTYHLNCVVDVSSFEGSEEALNEYMTTFECESCFWGLYPLPGQTVWCQQASFAFWPGRILYPKEGSARTLHSVDSFTVVYFGSKPGYYDGARYNRVVPLNIGAYDVLKKIKIYTDDPKLMTSFEEGMYTMDMSDSYRASILQSPEPIYKKIERNIYRTGKSKHSHSKRHHSQNEASCQCHEDKTAATICSYGSGCLNRDQSIECDDTTCEDSARCSNRMFSRSTCSTKNQQQPDSSSKNPVVPLVAFPTSIKGWGVRTTTALKRGDFVVEYVGEVISKELYQWRLGRKASNDALYFLELDTNLYIDAEYMGNLSRLINHSCSPNCSTEKYQSQGKKVVGIFANCDIQPGTELTFDYGYESSGKPFTCACGASNCRGKINRNDIRNNHVDETGRKRKSPSHERLDEEWNEECEICKYAGFSLICCEAPSCQKTYHPACLGLAVVPEGVWECPQHEPSSKSSNTAPKNGRKSNSSNTKEKPSVKTRPTQNNKENKSKNKSKPGVDLTSSASGRGSERLPKRTEISL